MKMLERAKENVMGGAILLVFACLRIWAGVPPEILLPGGPPVLSIAELPGPTIFAVLRNGRFCSMGRAAARLALEELYSMVPTATVYADAAVANTAGVRILAELGFMRTAVHPVALRWDGEVSDIWNYTLEPAVKKEEHL